MTPQNWKQVASGTFQNSVLKSGQISKDAGGWHIIDIGPFDLQNDADLEFQFVDVTNPGWKRGMKWDYVELRMIPQGNYNAYLMPAKLVLAPDARGPKANDATNQY